jgi:hypothetical protein
VGQVIDLKIENYMKKLGNSILYLLYVCCQLIAILAMFIVLNVSLLSPYAIHKEATSSLVLYILGRIVLSIFLSILFGLILTLLTIILKKIIVSSRLLSDIKTLIFLKWQILFLLIWGIIFSIYNTYTVINIKPLE